MISFHLLQRSFFSFFVTISSIQRVLLVRAGLDVLLVVHGLLHLLLHGNRRHQVELVEELPRLSFKNLDVLEPINNLDSNLRFQSPEGAGEFFGGQMR